MTKRTDAEEAIAAERRTWGPDDLVIVRDDDLPDDDSADEDEGKGDT